jgi:tyrosyl-tRNA synthetase
VALRADVELGGTDQLFNLMLAREIQGRYGMPAQLALTMPLLMGTDGTKKMSKAIGNYIGVTDAPEEQFGRAMSIPDATMAEWFRLLFPAEPPPTGHPGEEKRRLGRLIVARFHGEGAAQGAEEHFNRVVRDRAAPEDVPEFAIPAEGAVHLPALLVDALGIASRAEARRMIAQGGVSLDGTILVDLDIDATLLSGRVLKAGKRRFVRIVTGPGNISGEAP